MTARFAALLGALSLSASPAFAQAPQAAASAPGAQLVPTGRWVLDVGETQCTISRAFGSVEAPITLRLARSVAPGLIDTVVAGAPLAPLTTEVAVRTRFGDGASFVSSRGYSMRVDGPPRRLVRWYLSDTAFANQDITMDVEAGSVRLVFNQAQLGAAIRALNNCQADLRQHWNMSEDMFARAEAPWTGTTQTPGLATGSRLQDHLTYSPGEPTPGRPQPSRNPLEWVTSDDFGDNERPGQMTAYLLVGTDGRVADCTVSRATPDAILTARTCLLMRERARFRPARDAAGQAVRSVYYQRIQFLREGH